MRKTAAFLLFLVGSAALADNYSCVVDLYLAQQDRDLLQNEVGGHAFAYLSRRVLGTKVNDRSHFDRIKLEVRGIPDHYPVERISAGAGFYYFPGSHSVSQYFDPSSGIKQMVLAFQKIVAGPGAYVKAASTQSAAWNRVTYIDLTGVFLHSVDSTFDADFIKRYGEPLYVELEQDTKLFALDNGVYLIPGTALELVVPVKARALTTEEISRFTEVPKVIQVSGPLFARPGLR